MVEEEAVNVFMYIERDRNDHIDIDEFESFYTTTLYDQEQLAVGLTQTNSSVELLDVVATFICIPLAFVMFFFRYKYHNKH